MPADDNLRPQFLSEVTYELYFLGLLSNKASKAVKQNLKQWDDWNARNSCTTKTQPTTRIEHSTAPRSDQETTTNDYFHYF